MLGAELGQEVGRIIGQRIVDAEGPKIESTYSAEGTLYATPLWSNSSILYLL